MIYLLLICTLVMVFISAFVFKCDLIAPSFLLTSVFSLAVLCCCIYANKWLFHNITLIFIILAGLNGFVLFSTFVFYFETNGKKAKQYEIFQINITCFKLLIFLCFQLIINTMLLNEIFLNANSHVLSYAIGVYYSSNLSGTLQNKSLLINVGKILIMPGIYILIYVAINNVVCKKKNNVLLYVNILIGMIGSLLDGTRTTFFMYLVATFILYVVLRQKKYGWKKNINIKNLAKILLLFCIVIVVFSILFSLQGRTLSDITIIDLIANYIGAPIKNLELFIDEISKESSSFGAMTFRDTYSWINKIVGTNIFQIPNAYKYRWFNGKILGNVYTQLMPLYNDFGIFGVFIIMGFIGGFCQKIYNKIVYKSNRFPIDFNCLLYSYISFALIFSFFSNKFFEIVFARAIIYNIFGCWLFNMFFFRIKLSGSILKIKHLPKNRVYITEYRINKG